MRILHLADLHLGKRVNGFELLDDQRFVLEQVLALCEAHAVNAVILAGDLYDTAVPPAGAVMLLDHFLSELAARNIAVLAISGNHDSAERLSFGSALFVGAGIHMAGRFTGEPLRVTLADEFGPVDFTLMPFAKPATVAHYLPDADVSTPTAALRSALGPVPSPTRRSVLVAHAFVTAGTRLPEIAGSEILPPEIFSVGTVENVDCTCFDGFDYVALGHIHRPQQVGRETVRYAGSPLAYSLDECGASKSAVLLELGEKGQDQISLLPLAPKRALRHLTGPLFKLTAPETVEDAEDYIWATLTDDTPQPDAMARLRAAYPNAMRLDYASTAQDGPEAEAAARSAQTVRSKSFPNLFADFFEQVQGRAPSEAERAEVERLWREVRE